MAAQCEVVVSMVTNSGDVEALLLADEGVLAGLQPGSVHVDMSTIAPDSARKLAQACRNKGVDFLDAPVSGGVAGANNGTLAIMVGGDEAALERGATGLSRRWARPSCGSTRAARDRWPRPATR